MSKLDEIVRRSMLSKMYGEYILNGKKHVRCYHREIKSKKLKNGVPMSATDLMARALFDVPPLWEDLINNKKENTIGDYNE